MTKQTKSQITGKFNWNRTSFVQGVDALAIYDKVTETIKDGVWFDGKTQTMRGSNLPLVARVDSIVRPLGIRVANLRDLDRTEVKERIKDTHYSDAPALVLRTLEDTHRPNQELIDNLKGNVEEAQGSLRLPVLITGFDVEPAENHYGWQIKPRDDFAVLHDKRLDGKYDGNSFSEADENGLPKFKKNGSRTWFAKDSGLSGLCLGRDLDLYSSGEGLAYSDETGRVVLVSGEAADEIFLAQYTQKLKAITTERKSELDTWLKDSMSRMPGANK
jgi:hypothetical protein